MASNAERTERNQVVVSADESSESDSSPGRTASTVSNRDEEAKTIPFLRRLVDMLSDNDDVISFYPGSQHDDRPPTLGQIVVHDRLKIESLVLPRYFNHSSFASLRRQLNYFSFTRVGKGRQRGATYCNEGVVELEDILRLKRRPTTSPSSSGRSTKRGRGVYRDDVIKPKKVKCGNDLDGVDDEDDDENKDSGDLINDDSPPPSLPPARTELRTLSPVNVIDDVPHVMLDLTKAPVISFPIKHPLYQSLEADLDVLAGCNALLSFARGS